MSQVDTGALMLAIIIVVLTFNTAQFLNGKLKDCSPDTRRFFTVAGSVVVSLGFWAHSYVAMLAHSDPGQLYFRFSSNIVAVACAALVSVVLLFSKKQTITTILFYSLSAGACIFLLHVLNIDSGMDIRFDDISWGTSIMSVLSGGSATFLYFYYKNKNDHSFSVVTIRSLLLGALSLLPLFLLQDDVGLDAKSSLLGLVRNNSNLSDLNVTMAVVVILLQIVFLSIVQSKKNLRTTLNIKIGTLIVSMLILAILSSGMIIYRLIEGLKLEEFATLSQETLRSESDYFQRTSKDLAEEMLLLSHQNVVETFFEKQHPGEVIHRRVADLLMEYMKNNEIIWQARLIGPPGDGQELFRMQRFGEDIFTFNEKDLQKKGDRDYYQKTIKLNSFEYYVSDVNLNQERGKIEEPHRPTFRVATPIYNNDNNQLLGIFIVNVDFQMLIANLHKSTVFPMTRYVINQDGDFLVHPDSSKTFGWELGFNYKVNVGLPALSSIMRGDVKDIETRPLETRKGKQLIGAYKSYYIPGDKTRWIAFVGVVEEFVLDDVRLSFIVNFIKLCSVFTLIALAIIITLTRYIIQPISNLALAYKTFSEKKLVTETHAYQDDEIGDLSHSFYDLCLNVNRNEAELVEKTEFLNTILYNTYDGIIVIDDSGIIHRMNKAAEKLFLRQEKDMLGRNISELLPASIKRHHDEYIRRYLETGEAKIIGKGREVEAFRSNNEKINIELGITELQQDGQRYFVGTLKDITQKKIAEEELMKRQQELSSILETAVDGIITVDDEGLIRTANPAAQRLLGYHDESLVGRSIEVILPDMPDYRATLLQRTMIGSSGAETSAQRKNGTRFPIELSISEIKVDGRYLLTGILRDISERKKQEDALNDALENLKESQRQLLISNEELEKTTRMDPLTRIPNRRYFEETYEREFNRARRNQTNIGILMIDVDHFKDYNDHYGHQQGDECLKSVARVISESTKRSTDMAARYGGEEFIVLMPEIDREGLIIVAESMRHTLRSLQISHEKSPVADHVTISIGAYLVVPGNGIEKATIIQYADEALYHAKEKGRNQMVLKEAA